MFSMTEAFWISAILALAGWVHGFTGLGYGIVAMALLALMPHAMGPMAAVVSVTALIVLIALLWLSHEHGRVDWKQSALLLVGGLLGTPAGYAFIAVFGDRPLFRLALAGYLIWIGLAGMRAGQRRRRCSGAAALPMGVFAGFLAGAFVTGGPPIVIYLYSRTENPLTMKATIQFIFIVQLLYRIALMVYDPAVRDATLWLLSALACVPALAALWAGHQLSRGVSPAVFRRVVNATIAFLGVFVAGKTLWTSWL